jgi:hypothetical protein
MGSMVSTITITPPRTTITPVGCLQILTSYLEKQVVICHVIKHMVTKLSSTTALQSLNTTWPSYSKESSLMRLDTFYDSFGRLISLSQSPLPTQDDTTQKDEDKHSCLKRDSNPRAQRPSDQRLHLRTRRDRLTKQLPTNCSKLTPWNGSSDYCPAFHYRDQGSRPVQSM